MDYNYQELGFTCNCGHRETHVQVGVSSLVELICKWTCKRCGRDITARVPLGELVKDTPPHPEQRLLCAPEFSAEDVSLLADMNISFQKGEEREQA